MFAGGMALGQMSMASSLLKEILADKEDDDLDNAGYDIFSYRPNVLSVGCVLSTKDQLGQVSGGPLDLETILLPAKLLRDAESNNSCCTVSWPRNVGEEGQKWFIFDYDQTHLDAIQSSDIFEIDGTCAVLLAGYNDAKMQAYTSAIPPRLTCLILKRRQAVFQRLGLASSYDHSEFSDLDSNRRRYHTNDYEYCPF